MSLISTKGNYGLQAMLVLAQHHGKELLQIKEISNIANIPKNYLEQILVILKKEGLIASQRGANGGYSLLKSSNEIKVYDILNALECCIKYKDSKSENILDIFWIDVHKKIQEIFSLNLDELEEFLQKNSSNIIFHI